MRNKIFSNILAFIAVEVPILMYAVKCTKIAVSMKLKAPFPFYSIFLHAILYTGIYLYGPMTSILMTFRT